MDIKMLYEINPQKFIDVAKNTNNFYEFVAYLKRLPNFHIVDAMSDNELKVLYTLTLLDIKKQKGGK